MRRESSLWIILILMAGLLLSACSGGGGNTSPSNPTYHYIGGVVSGLSGTVVLQNNGTDDTTIISSGTFSFSQKIASGAAYSVQVKTQPDHQTCTIANPSGIVACADITNVNVTCAINTYSVGGVISGLTGTVKVQNNGGDDMILSSNGSFTFPMPVADTGPYSVTVVNQPQAQSCIVSNESGTINGKNISDVQIDCVNTYTVGGIVSGLTGSLVLQNNGGDNLTLTTNGTFTFSTRIVDGDGYAVSVLTNPTDMECILTNGTGTISSGNITNVSVACRLDTRKLFYVSNTNEDTVSILFSGSTITTLKKIAVGSGPNDLAIDYANKKVYVACKNSNVLSVVDMLSSSVVDTIPVGSRPEGVAINPNDDTLYVSNFNDATVSVITTIGSYSIVKNIAVGAAPDYIHINPAANRAYVSNYGDGSVSVIDTLSRTNIATITGVGGGTTGNAIDPNKERLYVVSSMSGIVSIISTTTNSILSTVTVGGAGAGGIALNTATNRAYVTDGSSGLHVLDTTLGSEKELSVITVGSAPCCNVFHSIVNRVYVGNCFGDSVSVVDVLTDTVIDTIAVGAFPQGIGAP